MTPVHFNPALQPPVGQEAPRPVRPSEGATQGPAFDKVLEGVQFSKHATQRVERRQLDVGPERLQRLADGVERAAGKGAKDAVVLVDDTAFVVSVANRPVITAVGRDQLKDQVFTNIDSAVIA
jgi:flagellar operon protein